jgi:DNA-binding response OmpR family regulator
MEKKTLLVVEDDETIRNMLRDLFAKRFRILEACDGEQALDFLGRGERVDVVICDIGLPRVNGVDLVRTMKRDPRWRMVPVIIATAHTSAMDTLRGINAGARAIIHKPFKVREMVEKVERAVA